MASGGLGTSGPSCPQPTPLAEEKGEKGSRESPTFSPVLSHGLLPGAGFTLCLSPADPRHPSRHWYGGRFTDGPRWLLGMISLLLTYIYLYLCRAQVNLQQLSVLLSLAWSNIDFLPLSLCL